MVFFLTCLLPKELSRFWLMACSSQRDWESILWISHQMHTLSLNIHPFFDLSYILYFWSLSTAITIMQNGPLGFVSYDHLCTQNICDSGWPTVLVIYLFLTKKRKKMTARLPQEDFIKAFWNVWSVSTTLGAGVWVCWVNPKSPGCADWTSSWKFGCTPCIRVLAPFGHFTFVYILWLSNSLLSLSALELALGNSRWDCQVSITSRRSYLFLVVSMTCCECRKRKLSRCFEMLRNLRKHSADLLKQFRKATAVGSAPILDTTNDKITCL